MDVRFSDIFENWLGKEYNECIISVIRDIVDWLN